MLDVNQLLDCQLRGFRTVLCCGRGHKDQRHRKHDSYRFVPSPHNAPKVRKSKIEFQTRDRRVSSIIGPARRVGKCRPQTRLAPLKRESQTKPRHERVDGEEWLQISIVCRIGVKEVVLSHDGLRIGEVEKVNQRYHVPPVIQHEFTGEAQIEHVYARKPRDSCRLKDDSLGALGQPPIDAENLNRLYRQARVVLEVHAGANLPGQFIAAVHFENISGVRIQIVIVAIDVVIGIGEIVTGGLIRKASPVNAFLALDGESGEQLPFVRQTLYGGKLKAVVGVIIQLWNICYHKVEIRSFGRVEVEERERLACKTVGNWLLVPVAVRQRGDRRVV